MRARLNHRPLVGATIGTILLGLGTAPAVNAQPSVVILHQFSGGTDGQRPEAPLIQANDGNFYGTTYMGGGGSGISCDPYGCGTVFQMAPDGTVTILHAFDGSTSGESPLSGVIQASDGNLYGTALGGPNGYGVIYRLTLDGTFSVVYSFSADVGNGPNGLLQASDGNFYGTASNGGIAGRGTIFRMTPDGAVTMLYEFHGPDGGNPAGLIQASDGNLYGVTGGGSVGVQGTVFVMTLDGTFTTLHQFTFGVGGNDPTGVVEGADGYLYGGTVLGGQANRGTIFKMTRDGASFIVLYSFSGDVDSQNPAGSLIQATDGNFYGTTVGGGQDVGSVFTITPDGTFTTLYTFGYNDPDGAAPVAGLVQGSDGSFYGTTWGGGLTNRGVVFRLTMQ